MEIDLGMPHVLHGLTERELEVTETLPNGLAQSVKVVVWVTADDSSKRKSALAKEAGIALLERALAALRA
jgi:hypothetical protein